jgi:hypothetical protein
VESAAMSLGPQNKWSAAKFFVFFTACLFLLSIISCKKLVESPPPSDKVAETNVYSVDATAISVLSGLYISFNGSGVNQPIQGTRSITLLEGLASDELTLYSGTAGTLLAYYQNNLSLSSGAGWDQWNPLYNYIFKTNAVIGGINKSNSLTPAIKQQLLGEAKFMRAFFYFYLVNLFGDVPLATSTDPKVNSLLSRTPKDQVYQQIIQDLNDAEELLNESYLDATLLNSTSERVRPTKWAAAALLARVYLYTGDYSKAEEQSSLVINNTTLFGPISTVPLNSVFTKNSKEAIWQIQPTAINFNTLEAQTMVLLSPSTGPNTSSNPVYLSNNLLASLEANDQRAVDGNWVNSRTIGSTIYRFSYKYKVNSSTGVTSTSGMTEYFMMLRLGEQYLIRAEARARLGNNLPGAINDLDKIRTRAGLTPIAIFNPGISQSALIDKILHERQVELFCEWGHRWFDLKRTGNIDAVMSVVTPQKAAGSPWQSYQHLCPIALSELQKAPNLEQTLGY